MKIKERQGFTQWWVWALLTVVLLIDLFAKYKTFYLKEPFGNVLPTDNLIETYDLLIFGVFLLFATARLVTEADNTEIRMRYIPVIFWWKRYRWTEMESVEVVDYDSLDEFWGWGIRYNFETWAYNVKGNQGVRIKMKSGDQILIGTQKPDEFRKLLKEINTEPNKT